MEHSKKIIRLPQASIIRLQNTSAHDKIKSVQTPGSVTSTRLDAEMNDILNSSTCKDEREKSSLYRQVIDLWRLRWGGGGEGGGEGEGVHHRQCARKVQKKAENLLRNLRAGGGVVWNNIGALTINGVVVPGTNIIGLINNAMRDRKRSMLVGHLQFAAALCNTAIPREFICSKRVWREVTNISLSRSLLRRVVAEKLTVYLRTLSLQ